MTIKYFALLTHQGAAKLANATALGTKLELTHLAVGDGGGSLPTPDPAMTMLIKEQRRAPLNSLSVDAYNPNQIITEQIIPENEGGFWIREIGLYDSDGDLIAIANCPETYKPRLQEGSGRTQIVRMILIVSHTQAVMLKIDPSVVLASRQFVSEELKRLSEAFRRELQERADSPDYPDASLTTKGMVQLSNDTDSGSDTVAATACALKKVNDLALGIADNLAKMLGDPVAARLHLGLGLLAQKDTLSAKDVNAIAVDELAGIPLPWTQAVPPDGWLNCNGASFDKRRYPALAKAYPEGKIPDLRGQFIRGWYGDRIPGKDYAILGSQRSVFTGPVMATLKYNSVEVVGISDDKETNNAPDSEVQDPVWVTDAVPGVKYKSMFLCADGPDITFFNYITRAA
ncbi:phage tail protein [Sodalis sp. dw_96]|uniref:phage tail-collar fiber domain-containing protein n=1 Tax=Sodalis sp. dw_96 TaxID=2719794 RepID=UPI001BD3C131|nr:phage tail protein [Sodalis sp. dw_96]